MRRKVRLPQQEVFTFAEIAALFGCSRTTVKKAVAANQLRDQRRTRCRRLVKRRDLLESPLFGKLIWQPPAGRKTRSTRLPAQALFKTAEVALRLGFTQQTVRNLIRSGELMSVKLGTRKLLVERASLKEFLKRRNAGGWPE
jgi:excisionase family DNA binding protein